MLKTDVAEGKKDRVDFISFDGLDYPMEYNRGYGEFRMLDRVMSDDGLSGFERRCSGKIVIWKVTGRYIVRNVMEIVRRQPQTFDLYCNYRNYPRRLTDSYLMGWTRSGYEVLLRNSFEYQKSTADNAQMHSEELFRSYLDERERSAPAHRKPRIRKRIAPTPRIHGVRAGDNQEYSRAGERKYKLRSIARTLFPWLWV